MKEGKKTPLQITNVSLGNLGELGWHQICVIKVRKHVIACTPSAVEQFVPAS